MTIAPAKQITYPVYYDVYTYLNTVIANNVFDNNPPAFFTHPQVPAGADPDDFVFFDRIHPTSAAHELLANDVYRYMTRGNYAPGPVTVDSEIAGGCFIEATAAPRQSFVLFMGLMAAMGLLMVIMRTRRN